MALVAMERVERPVPYDIAATADKIRRAGLPEALARRLGRGR